MNSKPGKLTGGGIRTMPPEKVGHMLRRIKESGSGKSRRVRSVRYRITGFRDMRTGDWISRNPRNGQYYVEKDGSHRTQIRPTAAMIQQTNMVALEVEVTRQGDKSVIYYFSTPGLGA